MMAARVFFDLKALIMSLLLGHEDKEEEDKEEEGLLSRQSRLLSRTLYNITPTSRERERACSSSWGYWSK